MGEAGAGHIRLVLLDVICRNKSPMSHPCLVIFEEGSLCLKTMLAHGCHCEAAVPEGGVTLSICPGPHPTCLHSGHLT